MAQPMNFKKRLCDSYKLSTEAAQTNCEVPEKPPHEYSVSYPEQELQRVTYRVSYKGNGEVVLDDQGHLLLTYSYPVLPSSWSPLDLSYRPYVKDLPPDLPQEVPLDLSLPAYSPLPAITTMTVPPPLESSQCVPTVLPPSIQHPVPVAVPPPCQQTKPRQCVQKSTWIIRGKKSGLATGRESQDSTQSKEGGPIRTNGDMVRRVQPGRQRKGINPSRHQDWRMLEDLDEDYDKVRPVKKMRSIKSIANLKDLVENNDGKEETEKEKSMGSNLVNQIISKKFKLKTKDKKLAKNMNGKNELLENERNKDPDYILPPSSKASCSMVEENVASGSKSLVVKDNLLTAKVKIIN